MQLFVNRVIKYLILSDLIFYMGWGLLTPVFAIFIIEKINGGTPLVVGIATSIYWIVISVLRIPFGIFLDKRAGERDDYAFMVSGLLLGAIIPFGYLYSTWPWQLYFLQAVYALGMAMSLAGWSAIFTRKIDKGREATEWSLSATGYSLGTGIAGVVGGYTVGRFGFEPVFMAVGILGIVGVLLLLVVRQDILKTPRTISSQYFNWKEIFNR